MLNNDINNAYLQKEYGDTVTLYRGVALDEKGIHPKQLMSFTSDEQVARDFAGGHDAYQTTKGYVITYKVPTKDIIFSHETDKQGWYGGGEEKEFVVFIRNTKEYKQISKYVSIATPPD
jgi:hypothetical protein